VARFERILSATASGVGGAERIKGADRHFALRVKREGTPRCTAQTRRPGSTGKRLPLFQQGEVRFENGILNGQPPSGPQSASFALPDRGLACWPRLLVCFSQV